MRFADWKDCVRKGRIADAVAICVLVGRDAEGVL